MPETPKKEASQKKVAKKVITVASVVQPEVRAAKAGLTAKTRSAKGAARAGEKGAQKAASRKPKTQPKSDSKPDTTKSTAKPKTSEGKSSKNPTPESRSRRAVQYAKRETGRRVQSARTEQHKTSSAVRSKYRRDKVVGLAEMRPKTRMLAAEFIAAVVIATVFLFVGDKSYHEKMSRFFVQLTGITGIFFFLALLGNSEKAGKWVVPFGLLIDLSMIGVLMRNSGADVITRSLGGTPKNKPGSGEPTPTPNDGGTGGPVHVISAETYNAPHPGGSGIPGVNIWPSSSATAPGSGTGNVVI